MNRKILFTLFTLLCVALPLLSACGTPATPTTEAQPTNTSVPPSATPLVEQPTPTIDAITFTTGQIVQEQGSGDICTSNATYFVNVDIASSGATTVEYRVDATDGSGQVPNGVFEGANSPEVVGTLTFNGTETQSLSLRLMGPYTYPDSIVVRVYVDGNVTELPLVCTDDGSGTPTSDVTTFTTGQIVQEQGSGDICTSSSTYFVNIDIASSGPTTVDYRVDATDGSGQVANGVFESTNSPEVQGTLTFNAAETQSLSLRLIGPYTYPDSIVARVYVNGNVTELPLVCTGGTSGNPEPTATTSQPTPTPSQPAASGAPAKPILTSYNYSCTATTATIDFLWTDMSNNEEGFHLYRNGTLIATLPADATAYSDSVSLSDGKTLSYLLVAYNSAGESEGSPADFTLNCQ